MNEFKKKLGSLNKEITGLEDERKKLIGQMEAEHPINRLHGKLVIIRNNEVPEYFDRFYISNYTGSLLFVNIQCYTQKKDGTMSKSLRVHYCRFDDLEDKIKEL